MSVYDEIIGIANDAKGEDVSAGYPKTVTGALDALADALAGSDVDGGHTIAEAVAAVGENIGGGGGGVDVGEIVAISAGDFLSDVPDAIEISYGKIMLGSTVVSTVKDVNYAYAAGGLNVIVSIPTEESISAVTAYDGVNPEPFADFESAMDPDIDGNTKLTFTVPMMSENANAEVIFYTGTFPIPVGQEVGGNF